MTRSNSFHHFSIKKINYIFSLINKIIPDDFSRNKTFNHANCIQPFYLKFKNFQRTKKNTNIDLDQLTFRGLLQQHSRKKQSFSN